MKRLLPALLTAACLLAGDIPLPRARDAARVFATPPAEYGMMHWWYWGPGMSEERIARELDLLTARGTTVVMIAPARGMEPRYLTPPYFERIAFAVAEAKRRGMRVWIADEGEYPSGFAGGKFNTDHPELRMQALVVAEKIPVRAGEAAARKLGPDVVGVLALRGGESQVVPVSAGGELRWAAPGGDWELLVIEHQFRTSPTRYIYHPTGAKDRTFSLCDYLNPAATQAFLNDVHEQYRKYIGAEFGRTVLGFFGDEPDYSLAGIPWTPTAFDEFQRRKGYDVRPFAARFFAPQMDAETKRAKADYWDVWSDLFRDNFFKPQADWCARYGMQYTVHLNHEEDLMELAKSEGDFFKDMRYVQMPAVDAIWRQIWMTETADYPKLASSAAHLWGRQRAMTESFAIYGHGLSLEQAKWVIDQQFARGINSVLTSAFAPGRERNPQMEEVPSLVRYANRASYLLAQGVPAAKIALYVPSRSLWLGDEKANERLLAMTKDLLERQRDFDYIDDQALATAHGYLAVLRPEGGGMETLPPPDVTLSASAPAVKYAHRRWRDADMYFLFNESTERVVREATLEGGGRAQVWSAETGAITELPSSSAGADRVKILLVLEPWEAKFIVVGTALPPASSPEPLLEPGRTITTLGGEWTIEIAGHKVTRPLQSWSGFGLPGYSGSARYRKEFTIASASGRLFLDCQEVRYSARAWLNGVDLGDRPWRPFRWEITKALKPGTNVLEIEVRNTPANEFAGDPEKQAKLKEEAAATRLSYLARSLPFDLEMLPSGLLPEVGIVEFTPLRRAASSAAPTRRD